MKAPADGTMRSTIEKAKAYQVRQVLKAIDRKEAM